MIIAVGSVLAVMLVVDVPVTEVDSWRCRNTVEVICHDGNCAATPEDEWTPLDVVFNTHGEFMVCAYTGCWEGKGTVGGSEPFLFIHAEQVAWSDPARESADNIQISFDRGSGIALVKAGPFAGPLNCR